MKTINIKQFLTFTIPHLTAGVLFVDIDHDSRLESVQLRKITMTDMEEPWNLTDS